MHRHQDRKIIELGEARLFQHCTKAQLQRIATIADRVDVGDGYRFCAEGTVGRELFIVRSGDVDVVRGGEHVGSVGPGDVLGEISLLAHRPRNASAVARGDVSVYVVNHTDLGILLEQAPGLAAAMLRTVCDRLLATPAAVG